MSARQALRAATAAEHDRVDALFSDFDLRYEAGYERFLAAQAAAFLPVEAALDASGAAAALTCWPERRRGALLVQDLARLGAADVAPVAPPPFEDEAAILGGIYVLEGSRLGGAVLRRNLRAHLPQAFLSAPQPRGAWAKLLAKLDTRLNGERELISAVTSAKRVFACFAAAAEQGMTTECSRRPST